MPPDMLKKWMHHELEPGGDKDASLVEACGVEDSDLTILNVSPNVNETWKRQLTSADNTFGAVHVNHIEQNQLTTLSAHGSSTTPLLSLPRPPTSPRGTASLIRGDVACANFPTQAPPSTPS